MGKLVAHLLVILTGFGAVNCAAPPSASGHLFIVGGGEQPPELVARFVELAGGPGHARIAVIPMASSQPDTTGAEKADELRGLGAEVTVLILTRAEAEDPAQGRRLDGMTGIWFTGGDQVPLARILQSTPVLAAIRQRLVAGAVVGGTSAGAAVMSDSMLTGNQRRPDSLGYYGDEYPEIARGAIEVVPGLGFLPGTIVDQHFVARERANRLLAVVLERPSLLGVGIDEGTALEVDDRGEWRVRGRGLAVVVDAREARITLPAAGLGGADIRLHLLPAGSRYQPRTGRATLPVVNPMP